MADDENERDDDSNEEEESSSDEADEREESEESDESDEPEEEVAAAAEQAKARDEARAKPKAKAADHDEDEEEEAGDHDGAASDVGTLGIERWVQFAFVVFSVVVVFLTDKIATLAWTYFSEPDSNIVLGGAVIIGILTGFGLYRYKKINVLAHDVANELAKVTWPSRQETWYSTVVVIVASVIMASYLGAFDALWSAFTDLIYSYSA